MVKVIETEIQSQEISSFYPFWQVVIIGVASGLLFYVLTFLIDKFVISPALCRSVADTIACSNTLSVSGNIAAIVVAIAGTFTMVRLQMIQPLIVAVTTAASLWGLVQWTNGLPVWEAVLWSVLTYFFAYLLFAWVVRYDRVWPVIAIIVVIVMAARIAANL